MNASKITPIFLFSLPRSGSTLLQRVLSTHSDIATCSEPWILLPFLSTLRKEGTFTDYRHAIAVKGIEDFYCALPGGRASYLAGMRTFVLKLYEQAAKDDVTYFLDKTPRYHLIIPEVLELFPDGKFIFLWRNPLAIIASMLRLFKKGRWELYRFQIDLFDGVSNMVNAAQQYGERICFIRYEDLITQHEAELKRVFSYLQLAWEPDGAPNFSDVHLRGRLGDPPVIEQYQSLSRESLNKWKQELSNPLRKAWCRGYLRWIGTERLQVMGYSLDELVTELTHIPFSLEHIGYDCLYMFFGSFYRLFEPHIIKSKLAKLPDQWRIYAHL